MASRPDARVPAWLDRGAGWGWRFLVVCGVAYVFGRVFSEVRVVVMPVVFALFLTAILSPPAQWLRRHHVRPLLATWLVFLASLGVLVGLGFWFVPAVSGQFSDIGAQASRGLAHVQHWLTQPPFRLKPAELTRYVDSAKHELTAHRAQLFAGAFKGISLAVETVATLLLTLVLMFFFVKDGDKIAAWAVTLFAAERADEARAIGRRCWEVLGGYIRGTAVNGLVNGTVIGATVAVLGVPLAFPLGLLTFVGAFIPLVGAIVAGVLAALVALVAKGTIAALVVVAATILVHHLEGYLVGPFVLGRAVHLHPVAVLLALTTGTVLAGVLGAFMAVPLLAIAVAVIGYYRGERADDVVASADRTAARNSRALRWGSSASVR